MSWVRIDDHAMEHPKVAGLPDGAFRLWVAGLSYCQKYLTDGVISAIALRALRSYSPKRRRVLVDAGLWIDSEPGVRVHDYLDWNDSREHVLNAREQAKKRLHKHRSNAVSNTVQNANGNAHAAVGGVRGSVQMISQRARTERGAGENRDELGERAGKFVNETYPTLYEKHRKGARYISRPALDFQEAMQLCRVWDDERLEKLAIVFLTTDHEFAEKGSRTIAQFRSMASWCDGLLAKAGIA